jgi:CofD-related protein of GAK system
LAAELEDGTHVAGQHRITGKEVAPLQSPVKRLYLSERPDKPVPATAELRKKTRKLISNAELVCYAPGSFYSSLIANLLPAGVSPAIAGNDCPKVYVPNLGRDPEQIGMTLNDCVHSLLDYLHAGMTEDCTDAKLLNFVLLDSRNGEYVSALPVKPLQKRGIQLVDTPLVTKKSAPYYDAELLVYALLSLT